ncbi:hypothetical protein HRH59_03950 [Rheinheimera sp. YQF-2]|uniref:Uncharacterized protein n=1 Tax=Rheinheimera lutimaris TaxID=2740584 RepID=A0A7Y5ANR5_9GAMM|nr:hypothetical protein [Rheinheimera lutimaris]NRQ41723.1 hypothetical protein [Rheinheimera lutimaris]
MRNQASNSPADSVFMRELKRVLNSLSTPASALSLVSIAADFFRATHSSVTPPTAMAELSFLAEKILQLTEGQNNAETLTRSARLLGILQLTVPKSKRRWREVQFGYKALYRAALSLRLLQHMLTQQLLNDPWIEQHYAQRDAKDPQCPFRLNVQLPLVMAVLLLDVGMLHPKALAVLAGNNGTLDPQRALQSEERHQLLQLSTTARQHFFSLALAVVRFRSNNKQEQQLDMAQQQQRLDFTERLLAAAGDPNSAVGSLLKVPQVYSSIVLPGRQRFAYEALPKATLLLKDAVKRGELNALYTGHLLKITGVFPQGFGVAFIPAQTDLSVQEKYELAIVNQLYPAKAEEPLCRVVSRNLQYRRGGHNSCISVANNLYFKPARDRLAIMPPQRLQEILAGLSADFEPGQLRRFIPRCWHPEQFFSQSEHQNLWNNAPQRQN